MPVWQPGSLQVRQTHGQHASGKNGERQAHHLTGGHRAHVGAGSGGGHLLPSSGQLGGQGTMEGPRSRSQRVGLHAGKVESPVWLWRGWGSGTGDPHPARPRASRSPASCSCTVPAGWGPGDSSILMKYMGRSLNTTASCDHKSCCPGRWGPRQGCSGICLALGVKASVSEVTAVFLREGEQPFCHEASSEVGVSTLASGLSASSQGREGYSRGSVG